MDRHKGTYSQGRNVGRVAITKHHHTIRSQSRARRTHPLDKHYQNQKYHREVDRMLPTTYAKLLREKSSESKKFYVNLTTDQLQELNNRYARIFKEKSNPILCYR